MNRGHSIYGYDKFIRLDELETPQLKSLIFAIHRVVKDRDGFILQINKLKMTEYKSNSWAEDTLEQELTHPISIFFSHNLTQAMFIKKDFQSVEDSSQDSVNVCFVGYADSYPEPILKKLGFRFDVYNKQVSEFIINSDYDVLEGSLAGFFSEDSPFVELEIINDYGRVEKIRIDIFSIECANGGKNITIIEGFSDYGPTRIILEKGAILSVQYNKE